MTLCVLLRAAARCTFRRILMRRVALFLLSFLLLASLRGEAQTRTLALLKASLEAASSTSARLSILLRICEEREALSADTLAYYAALARNVAIQTSDAARTLEAEYYTGLAIQAAGHPDSALMFAEARLARLPAAQYALRQKFSYLRTNSLIRLHRYREAIESTYVALRGAEEKDDKPAQMINANLIGWACMEMGSEREALNWFYRSISMQGAAAPDGGRAHDKSYGIACSNMAAVYNNLQRFDSGERYVLLSIDAARRSENLKGLANALAIRADGLFLTGRGRNAEAPLREAVAIRRLVGDPFYIVSDLAQLAFYYAGTGRPAQGLAATEEGLRIAQQYRLAAKLPILYQAQADCYKVAGDAQAHATALEHLMAAKDSLYELNTAEALGALQAQYDVAKAENVIIRQRLAILRQNAMLLGAAVLMLLIALGSFLLFRRARRRQQQEVARIQEEDRLASALAVREAEEAERKRIAADLHDNLGAYAAAIASNIDYLEPAMMMSGNAPTAVMQELRANSRDMVSQLSDTIWVLKKDALPLTAISDRLKIFVQRVAASYPGIQLDVVERIEDDRVLSPLQAFHLFRIVQEAVTNAVRHSGGSRVTVLLESVAVDYHICITDDGRGMGAAATHRGDGTGLYSMRARAKAGGWEIAWNLAQPKGTEVCIRSQPAAATPN